MVRACSKNEALKMHHGILADHWDRVYPSDHYPVVASIMVPCKDSYKSDNWIGVE